VAANTRQPDELVKIDDRITDDASEVIGSFVHEHPSPVVASRQPSRGVV